MVRQFQYAKITGMMRLKRTACQEVNIRVEVLIMNLSFLIAGPASAFVAKVELGSWGEDTSSGGLDEMTGALDKAVKRYEGRLETFKKARREAIRLKNRSKAGHAINPG